MQYHEPRMSTLPQVKQRHDPWCSVLTFHVIEMGIVLGYEYYRDIHENNFALPCVQNILLAMILCFQPDAYKRQGNE